MSTGPSGSSAPAFSAGSSAPAHSAGRVPLRALVVAHHASSSPGRVGRYLEDRGYALTRVTLGDERLAGLPAPGGFDVVVVLGSAHSVTELDEPGATSTRWLRAEVEWMRDAVRGNARVLGICFGAQVMARALGATVARMPGTQVGWFDLTAVDTADPVFGGPWLEYHDDCFTLPDGARLLASDRFCPQAFTIGRSMAVQFHPEADVAIVQRWVDRFPTDEAGLAVGVDRHALVARTVTSADASAQRCLQLMDLFLALDTVPVAAPVATGGQRSAVSGRGTRAAPRRTVRRG